MSRRNTVNIKIDRVEQLIKQNGWSSSTFCTLMMGKQRGWVTEWKRGKNFPSPEEAAKLCLIFDVQPAEIIENKEDEAIVFELLNKKAPSVIITEGADIKSSIIQEIQEMSEEECRKLSILIEAAKKL